MPKGILLGLAAVLSFGCFEDSQTAELAPTLSLATFNAGLARGFVAHADERLPEVATALAELDADVVCLQEVWEPDQIEAILESTKALFPHAHYETPDPSDRERDATPSCSEQEAASLGGCVQQNCADVPIDELTGCTLSKCSDEFGALSAKCRTCIAANVGKPSDEILETCTNLAAGGYAYEGHNGLLLLSRRTLSRQRFIPLESHLTARAALSARVDHPGMGPLEVYCTHLTANLHTLEYAGQFESWQDERRAQIGRLLDDIERREDPTPVVLMGDLNCGPEVFGVGSEYPQDFDLFGEAGFEAPYVEETAQCTWCGENPLTVEGDAEDSVIDHILIEQDADPVVLRTGRILDEPITLTIEGEQIHTRLSDHYGVRVDIAAM